VRLNWGMPVVETGIASEVAMPLHAPFEGDHVPSIAELNESVEARVDI
jgi:hypothetical protein